MSKFDEVNVVKDVHEFYLSTFFMNFKWFKQDGSVII